VRYEDRVTISTPEALEMELPLAGLGSRLAARLLDSLLQGGLLLVTFLILAGSFDGSSVSEAIVAAVAITASFIVLWGYDVLFEAFGGGRTPGKRAVGLRVVAQEGGPETFAMAAVRNLLRLIDEYLTLFGAGVVAIAASKKNQRLGDMAAGTLVIKDKPEKAPPAAASISVRALESLDAARTWDTGAVTSEELHATRIFLERRGTLATGPRAGLARDLAARLRPKVAGSEQVGADEEFLELLLAARGSG
jgi:uncharacterized RDD family membrane protein YckC